MMGPTGLDALMTLKCHKSLNTLHHVVSFLINETDAVQDLKKCMQRKPFHTRWHVYII
jgi:hypothetical protein